jgi:dipeptidyl aminopeptidase/acylaminoacyl peptidase
MPHTLPLSRQRQTIQHLLTVVLAALVVFGVSSAHAEPERVSQANYKQAFKYSSDYLKQFVYDTAVNPNWIGKTDSFWYSYRTSKGTTYYRVNPKNATKEPLFDQVKLGTLLSEMVQKPLDAASLPLTRLEVNAEGTKAKFVVADLQYEYELQAEKLSKLGKAPPAPPPGPGGRGGRGQFQRGSVDDQYAEDQGDDELDQLEPRQPRDEIQQGTPQRRGGQGGAGQRGGGDYRNFAPDRKVYVFAKKHNLYLVEDNKENDAVQLTTDGTEDYSFGGGNDDRKARPLGEWAPDSKSFYVTRMDSRGIKELYLVNPLSSPRPALEKYKYAMPGEEAVRKPELHVFDREKKKITRVPPKWKDETYNNLHWGKAAGELRFVRRDRLLRHIEFCALNVATGECKCLISEGFENSHIDFQPVRYLDESDEMIWWSERGGWGHFHLCDRDGKCKNAITSGPFRASRIVEVDPKNRVLYFEGNARESGENVYYQHLYSVHLDGTGLTLLDPGNANHQTRLSPSRQYVVDNWSRVDQAPVSVLRDASGRQVMELEKADLSRLYEVGWKMPETFVVKAVDGVTDLFGNMWKPFDFDPKKKYPIIANVYPGPQQEGVTHTFSAVTTNQQLAQLGFIVIQVGHRGGAPGRSKAYASYGYFNLRDYGLADKKSAIEQLAARCPFLDIDRVGIYGHSGGGFMSAAAVLQKPYNEFFKAAVASAGNHDNNIYNNTWSEHYHGLKEIIVKKEDPKKDEKKAEAATTGGAKDDQDKKDGDDEGTKQDEKKDEKKTDDGKVEKKDDAEKKDQGDKKEEKKDDKAKAQEEVKFEIKVPTNAELAANLKGHLLLVHGDMDNNVHPANTMRLVDALIKANKRFDMLILPGKRHAFADYQPYFNQRMWDFFADHLLGDRQTGSDILEKQNNHH